LSGGRTSRLRGLTALTLHTEVGLTD
jgi:hypothetical protein